MTQTRPTLFIFSGLPASGKSTLAQRIAELLNIAYLRIDTLEQCLRELCSIEVEGEGYRLAYRIAADNLRLGVSVVADSCNPLESTRREWERVALEVKARYVNIEVICSDSHEHRRRVETRAPSVPGMRLPTWDEVENRRYDTWSADRVLIDTSGRSVAECVDELRSRLFLEKPLVEAAP